MKIVNGLVLMLMLLSGLVGCSTAPKTTQENVNLVVSETPNSQTAQQDSAGVAESPQTGAQQTPAPDAVVKDLYKTHDKDYGAILNGKSRTQIDKYFDKNLANLFWKDLTTHKDEIGVIDFDPFYNTQDPDIKNLTVGAPKIEGAKAAVPVSFTNSGRKETITYALVQQNSAWKIADIKYEGGNSLLGYFKENAKTEAAQKTDEEGNFEGTYQVGSTTATVKPIKMAFELKWAKGAGTMIFFYSGQGVLEYSSEDKGNGVDTFIFDDTTFTTGKFIRGSDGKEMPVKKIK